MGNRLALLEWQSVIHRRRQGIATGLRHKVCDISAASCARFLRVVPSRAYSGGSSSGKWIVPLDVWKALSSFSNVFITAILSGNKLQCFENAAKPTTSPWYLNIGIP